MENRVYIGIGSNEGDRMHFLQTACESLELRVGRIMNVSRVYESDPKDMESTNKFLNMALLLVTEMPAAKILKTILEIESDFGRVRESGKVLARNLDLDILFFNDETIDTPTLQIPHPRIQERNFVLLPMIDIAEFHIHPKLGKSMQELLKDSNDSGRIDIYHWNTVTSP